MKKWIAAGLCLLLCACAPSRAPAGSEPEAAPPLGTQAPAAPSLARETAGLLLDTLRTADLPAEEQVRAIYLHILQHTFPADPVGLDAWRYAGAGQDPPSYVESRALGPLLYGVGSFEDFAAATVVLLREAGFESRYVAGYARWAEGGYVDHAWAAVELEGGWYHLDPWLEQRAAREGRLAYRYYLLDDNRLAHSHLWGERLIAAWPEPVDEALVREEFQPPACTSVFPRPEPREITLPLRPDPGELSRRIEAARGAGAGEPAPPDATSLQPPVLAGKAGGAHAPAGAPRYARSFLSADQQSLYDAMLRAAEALEEGAALALPPGLGGEGAEQAAAALLEDNPQLYWARFPVEEGVATLALRSDLTPAQVRARQEEIERAAAALMGPVGATSPPGAVAAAHDRLAELIHYDDSPGYLDANTLYGGLVLNRGTCDSYSRSFQYLMGYSGVDCIYIRGQSIWGVRHSWNAVRLTGRWYYVDVTYDVNKEDRLPVFHDYLGVSLEEMAREHIWDMDQYGSLPPSTLPTFDYYRLRGYGVAAAGDTTEQLAGAFAAQLRDKELPRQRGEVLLEVKVLGTPAEYQAVKEHFLRNIFQVLQATAAQARAQGLPVYIQTDDSISCNFNDTMQVITLFPVVEGV